MAGFAILYSGGAGAVEHSHADRQAATEGHHGHHNAATTAVENGFAKKPAVGTKAKCPVTGEEFTVSKDTPISHYKGKYYAFCCPSCKPKFDANPEKYLK